ncbi:MAG TPA: serine/threonine-protein kinase [Pseudomonadota bacterium]|nr:serine/threonine-protein kinase [Pseudomonadota bacterium]
MSTEEPPPPERLGPYRIIRQIGQGGMGVVYEAVHEGISRRVAIKLLRSEYAHNSQVAQRFFNEARAANLIEHPALVQISEFGQLPDGSTYLVMELLKGENLARRVRRVGALPLSWVLRIGCQLAEALDAAHQKSIVHRDLKPENVMLVSDSAVAGGERVKLLDFGIAKLAEAGPNRTATSALMGTPKYMSPEQARGAGSVDEKTDVYALGVMLFELLTGRPPFEGESGELIAQHLYVPAPQLTSLLPTVPAGVAQLIGRLLEKDKLQRPTMATAHHELQEQLGLLHDQELVPAAPGAPGTSAPQLALAELGQSLPPRKDHSTLGFSTGQLSQTRKRASLIGAGVVVVLVGIGGWGLFRGGQKDAEKTAAAALPTAPAAGGQQPDAPTKRSHWSIRTTPPAAQVLRAADQHELGQTPWSFEPPAGSGDQAFIVRRKGYHDQTLHFHADADSDQAVVLERKLEAKKDAHAKPAAKIGSTSAPLFTPKTWMSK